MRPWVRAAALLFALAGAPIAAAGQDATSEAQRVTERADPGGVAGERWVRPPEGMRRGTLSVPAWVVVGLGSALAVGAAAFLLRRTFRRGR